MITTVDIPPEVEQLDLMSKKICEQMLCQIPGKGLLLHCDNGFDLLSITENVLLFINKGVFKYFYDKKAVRFYEAGDCIPIFHETSSPHSSCISEFGADITLFHLDELSQGGVLPASFAKLFFQFISVQSRIMHILCALNSNDEFQPEFIFRSFDANTVIIAEDSPAQEIYLMVQGTATVTVKNIEVGTIMAGEVFGEISFFTSGARSATVKAATECLVQVMHKDSFLALIKMKPSVNLQISKTLSQRLIETNRKIAEHRNRLQG